MTEEMLGAASVLIREWAQSSLGIHFTSLSALARHLVDNLFVDNQSLSAVCILCACGDSSKSSINRDMTGSIATPTEDKSLKHREAQLQLQRKLQQRGQTREAVDQGAVAQVIII